MRELQRRRALQDALLAAEQELRSAELAVTIADRDVRTAREEVSFQREFAEHDRATHDAEALAHKVRDASLERLKLSVSFVPASAWLYPEPRLPRPRRRRLREVLISKAVPLVLVSHILAPEDQGGMGLTSPNDFVHLVSSADDETSMSNSREYRSKQADI